MVGVVVVVVLFGSAVVVVVLGSVAAVVVLAGIAVMVVVVGGGMQVVVLVVRAAAHYDIRSCSCFTIHRQGTRRRRDGRLAFAKTAERTTSNTTSLKRGAVHSVEII